MIDSVDFTPLIVCGTAVNQLNEMNFKIPIGPPREGNCREDESEFIYLQYAFNGGMAIR